MVRNYLLLLCIITGMIQQNSLCTESHNRDHAAYVTHALQTDGFGSQFQNIIAAAVYAELHNKQYAYTPFIAMEHNYDNEQDFLTKKEQFINLINYFPNNKPEYNASIATDYKKFFDRHIIQCAQSKTLATIKRLFRANKNIENYFGKDQFTIVVHVRRHNAHDSRIAGTDTPDSLFLTVIQQLQKLYADRNPCIHLYSQGVENAFMQFKDLGVTLHLNESVEDTFLGMVLADVLVISPSSFSYTAGLLSDGAVYYMPFWHTPLRHWLSVEALLS